MERRSKGGLASLLVAIAAAVVIAAAPVTAISDVTETGNVGQWLANDSAKAAGATCTYNDNFRLVRIKARAPIVYAYRAGGQVVGWRMKIVHRYLLPGNDQYAEETIYKSSRKQRRGYGTAALDAVVAYLRTRPGADVLYTSASQGVGTPQPFYERYGFVPTGGIVDGEVVLALDLRRPSSEGAVP